MLVKMWNDETTLENFTVISINLKMHLLHALAVPLLHYPRVVKYLFKLSTQIFVDMFITGLFLVTLNYKQPKQRVNGEKWKTSWCTSEMMYNSAIIINGRPLCSTTWMTAKYYHERGRQTQMSILGIIPFIEKKSWTEKINLLWHKSINNCLRLAIVDCLERNTHLLFGVTFAERKLRHKTFRKLVQILTIRKEWKQLLNPSAGFQSPHFSSLCFNGSFNSDYKICPHRHNYLFIRWLKVHYLI